MRGFWMFANCPEKLKEIKSKFGAELNAQLQRSTEEEVPKSSSSLTDANWVELTDATSTGTSEAASNSLAETPTKAADMQIFGRKYSNCGHACEYADKLKTSHVRMSGSKGSDNVSSAHFREAEPTARGLEEGSSFPAVTKSNPTSLFSRVRKFFE